MMHPSDATPDRGKPSMIRTRCRSHEHPKSELSTTPAAAGKRSKDTGGSSTMLGSNDPSIMTPSPRIVKEPSSAMTDMTEPMTPFTGTPYGNSQKTPTPLVSSQPSVAPMRAPVPPSASSISSNCTPPSFSILQEGYIVDDDDASPLKGQYQSRALFQNESETPYKSSSSSSCNNNSDAFITSSPPRGTYQDQGLRVLPESTPFGSTRKSFSTGNAAVATTVSSSHVNFIHDEGSTRNNEHTLRRHRSNKSQSSSSWDVSSQEISFGIQERRRSHATRSSHDGSSDNWSLRSSSVNDTIAIKKSQESSSNSNISNNINNPCCGVIEEPSSCASTPDTSSLSSSSPHSSPSRKEKTHPRSVTTRKSISTAASVVASVPNMTAIVLSRMKRMKATEFFVLLCMMRLVTIFFTEQPPKIPKVDTHSQHHNPDLSSTNTVRKGALSSQNVEDPTAHLSTPVVLDPKEFEMEDGKHRKRNHLMLKKMGPKALNDSNNKNGAKDKKIEAAAAQVQGSKTISTKKKASSSASTTMSTKIGLLKQQQRQQRALPLVARPTGFLDDASSTTSNFDDMDLRLYNNNFEGGGMRRLYSPLPRTVHLHDHSRPSERSSSVTPSSRRAVDVYPAEFTDNTQFYGFLNSDDEKLSKMEMREPYLQGECVPMQDWQTKFHPSCNEMHGLGMSGLGYEEADDYFHLFGTGGFWRHAWRVDVLGGRKQVDDREPVVLKTLKFDHNFEDAHFEHDRIDAVAMERLTSSPHVINVFGFCGHSVLTEFADGKRVGQLADKAKKIPLSRLKIARDIASGLADVHGIDGDGNATFVHLDINPANVVSIGGTLKLNDFNIGQILLWNTTSNKQCGFSNAQYPNPQWRSPEEAKEEMLTEKVDVFSMGHIFFRLICGHEPWNKLEPGGKPEKEEVHKKVVAGVLPFIPEHVMETTDKEVIAIRDAMLQCYTYEPGKRPNARQIARELDKALRKLSRTHRSRRK